ncbi:MAG: FHA domain-containing protein [Deltaproteobacteria bacterium]|nr:FHA domain-containing protein [Deltaproteobacteria bacterium]
MPITIYMLSGPLEGRSFELDKDTIYIGRSSKSDVQIKDASVSRQHIEMVLEGDKTFIVDLKSTNGTFVNARKLTPEEKTEIEDGLPITIGNIFFSVNRAYTGDLQILKDEIVVSRKTGEKISGHKWDRPMTLVKNMELLQKVSHLLMQPLDINQLLEKILDFIFELLGRIDRGLIILIDSDTEKILDIITSDKQDGDATVLLYSRNIVDQVIEEGRPVMMTDTSEAEENDFSESMEMMKIKSVMCVPLISRSKLMGVLYVDSINRPFGFRKDDLALLTALGSPAAVAIENASLHASLQKIK